jgi:hypothetical protein
MDWVLLISSKRAGLHEIAHAALAADPAGQAALSEALLAKLARVFLLAPVCLGLFIWNRRRGKGGTESGADRRFPFPWFVLGFVVMSLFGSCVLPAAGVDTADWARITSPAAWPAARLLSRKLPDRPPPSCEMRRFLTNSKAGSRLRKEPLYRPACSAIARAIQTPAAAAWARPRVTPAPSPPQYRPEISVSSVSLSFGRAE